METLLSFNHGIGLDEIQVWINFIAQEADNIYH